MSSALPGSRGLILGDIFGKRAGETCTEETDERFLLPRAARRGVLRSEVEDEGRICGDCVAERVIVGLTNGE